MEWNEFIEALKKVIDTGNVQLAKKLEKIAKEKNNPYYFFLLGNMFDPVPQEFIDNAIKRREAIQLKMMAEHVPCEILDNLENLQIIKDCVSSEHYYKLAFEGLKKLAELDDTDAMSMLSDLYFGGPGTAIDEEKAKYWKDRCYLLKAGVTYTDWLKINK